jgi:hypothetical protein
VVTPVALRAPSVTTAGESVHDVLALKLVNDVLALESYLLQKASIFSLDRNKKFAFTWPGAKSVF